METRVLEQDSGLKSTVHHATSKIAGTREGNFVKTLCEVIAVSTTYTTGTYLCSFPDPIAQSIPAARCPAPFADPQTCKRNLD